MSDTPQDGPLQKPFTSMSGRMLLIQDILLRLMSRLSPMEISHIRLVVDILCSTKESIPPPQNMLTPILIFLAGFIFQIDALTALSLAAKWMSFSVDVDRNTATGRGFSQKLKCSHTFAKLMAMVKWPTRMT